MIASAWKRMNPHLPQETARASREALRERGLSANPALPLLRPRKRDAGLRKSELARVQFRHYDGRNLTVFGKGQKVRYLLIVDQELRTGTRAADA